MADYILLMQMDIPTELEDDFNHFYNTQYVPNLLRVDGVHKCTRFWLETSPDEGMARYAAIYKVDSPNIHESKEWQQQANIECDRMTKIRPNTYNRTFTSFKEIS